MSALAAAAFVVLAATLAGRAPRAPRRLARLTEQQRAPAVRTRPPAHTVWAVAAAAALAAWGALGPWAGMAAGGIAVAVGRRRPAPMEPLDVPLVADLMAACLAAGATFGDALRAAGGASPAAGDICRPVADRLAAGAPPREAWAGWFERPELATIARACVRAADSGSATTQELRRAGDRVRAQRRAELARRAQRAGVWAVLPLGLCFLPAFVLVGIVPFALGLLGR